MLVNVTIPVYNEEKILPSSIATLHAFLTHHCRFDWEIVVANNASIDNTLKVAQSLSREFSDVRAVHLDQKGRGRALKQVWTQSTADILAYMDVDLSSNLYAFPPMIEALISGGFDLATGSRLLKGSTTKRSMKREIVSRGYNLLVKAFFFTKFSDAQCGFKAITKEAAENLMPKVTDTGWFFDTELLVIAEKLGYRIFDLPVSWVEDLDTRVKIARTALDDINGLIRVRRNFWKGLY
jgi:glycosyltransferase involved in cell wall biosynthesis